LAQNARPQVIERITARHLLHLPPVTVVFATVTCARRFQPVRRVVGVADVTIAGQVPSVVVAVARVADAVVERRACGVVGVTERVIRRLAAAGRTA
ncbi:MAG: hypothetical protein MN733_24000, partial [Nitrososphaera sp.]|nr:hypothetical protein [Nitrososphaera sp.]